jgi:hypothetical protein
MKIEFNELVTTDNKLKISFNNGETYVTKDNEELLESGYTIPEDITDYSTLKLSGTTIAKTAKDVPFAPKMARFTEINNYNNSLDPEADDYEPKSISTVTSQFNINYIRLPEGITEIYSGFFIGQSYNTIYFPKGLQVIRGNQFNKKVVRVYLPKSLTAIATDLFKSQETSPYIYYEGTEEEWNTLLGGSELEGVNSARITFNYNY